MTKDHIVITKKHYSKAICKTCGKTFSYQPQVVDGKLAERNECNLCWWEQKRAKESSKALLRKPTSREELPKIINDIWGLARRRCGTLVIDSKEKQ